MIRLQVIRTTDDRNVGLVVEVPGVNALGILTVTQIQAIAAGFADGQFKPTAVLRNGDRVRLVSSNYSVELEKI